MSISCKLVCGSDEIDLMAGGYKVEAAGFNAPPGTTEMTVPLQIIPDRKGAVWQIIRLEQQVKEFLNRAEAWEKERIGAPVEFLWRIDDGVGAEPTYGTGSFRRRVTAGKLVPPTDMPAVLIPKADRVPRYTLRLQVRPWWHQAPHYLMCGQGGIMEVDGGLQIWEGTVNLCEAPGYPWTWTAIDGVSLEDYDATVLGPWPREYGRIAITAILAGATGGAYRDEVSNPAQSEPYTLSAYIRGVGGTIGKTATITIEERGGASAAASTSETLVLTDEPQRVVVTHTIVEADRTDLRIQITIAGSAAGEFFVVGGVQLENKAYATPYADGFRGLGHWWDGTEDQSTSTRLAAGLWGSTREGVLDPAMGWLSVYVSDVDWDSGRTAYVFDTGEDDAYNRMRLYKSDADMLIWSILDRQGNEETVSVDCSGWTDGDTYHIVAVWARNDMRLYVNGTEVGTAVTSCDVIQANDCKFYLGCDRSIANQLNGTIRNDFRIYDSTPTDKQVKALYDAGEGPGMLGYVAARAQGRMGQAGGLWDQASVLLQQFEDTGAGNQNWAQLGNIPGDLPAPMRWWVRFGPETLAGHRSAALYYGLRSRAGGEARFNFDAYLVPTTYDGDTAAVADGDCAYGYKARTTPASNGWWASRMSWIVTGRDGGIWTPDMRGRWKVFARVYDGAATTGIFKVRIRTGGNEITPWVPDENGVSAPAVGQWCLMEIGEVEYPSWEVGEENLLSYIDYQIYRESGAATFDTDFLLLVPQADGGRLGVPGGNYNVGFSAMEQNNIYDDPYATPVYWAIVYGPNTDEPFQQALGSYLELQPGRQHRLVLANISHTNPNTFDLSEDYQMSLAVQIEPRYETPW